MSNTKIIIYEAVPVQANNRISHYNIIRKFELTRKGWKSTVYKSVIYSTRCYGVEDVATVRLDDGSM